MRFAIDPLADSRWGSFVATHPDASLFHSTAWLKALKIGYGYDPVVITTSSPNEALTNGVPLCQVESWFTGRRLVSLPFSDHCEPLLSRPTELDDLLLQVQRYANSGKWEYVEIRPITCEPHTETDFAKSVTYSLQRLDLRKSPDELFSAFHHDCVQRKIRRAEREDLRYEEGCSEKLVRAFYDLQVMTRRRKHLPPQPKSWFRTLAKEFPNDLKIRVSWKGNLPIASIITITHKNTMVYKYGCSDVRFHNLGGTALLFWKAIQDAKSQGLEQFDMGRSEIANAGLISFKEHWGAVSRQFSHWAYPTQVRLIPTRRQKSMLRRMVPLVPDAMLRMAGNLLYRHIG